jgi:ubiquinone/menaquinone biosynthesis C-methylase UbiE/uncharacterized protein YbaR (Trm112 family)
MGDTLTAVPRWHAILDILVCPRGGGRIRPATDAELEAWNVDGTALARVKDASSGDALLVSEDGRFGYRVVDGILELTPDSAISLVDSHGGASEVVTAAKQQVRDFYDEFGWEKEDGVYHDTLVHEDLRRLSFEYAHKSHVRVRRCLSRSGGKFLLDVGSGPVQYPDYRDFQDPFEFRICVDISRRALLEAKSNIGDRGIYVLADATRLPFRDDAIDAVVSLHLLYHIPAEEQHLALAEITRVLRPGSLAVLVYLSPFRTPVGRFLYRLTHDAASEHSRLSRVPGLRNVIPDKPDLYVHSHGRRWFRDTVRDVDLDIRVYRTLSPTFMKLLIHERLLGQAITNGVVALEERFPHVMSRVARYLLLVARKPPPPPGGIAGQSVS